MTMLVPPKQTRLKLLVWLAAGAAAACLGAQTPSPRITSEISRAEVAPLKSSLHPWAQAQFDAGRMPAGNKLTGMTMVFNRTAAQQADLEALLAAQQDPSSPLYHQWLTPDQFAARFGMAQTDLDQVETWLQQQGFSIDWVARSRNMIRFSGTVGQVEQAFQTEMHYYQVDGAKHFAPSTDLSLPAALASTVEDVRNLSDFRPKPMHITARSANVTPDFTSSISGSVFFAPGDVKVVYDMNPLISGGFTGAGQTITVVGQSSISVGDIEAFETAAGLTKKDPDLVYVPGTGAEATASGDQAESDLDIEWATGIATGANIDFVYVGNNQNNSVFDSITYAVDQKLGDVISISYGACEPALGTFTLENTLQQAAAQGQTVVAASGDQGSTACQGDTNLTTAGQQALAVNYPASSDYVLGIGGTEITSDNDKAGTAYWSAKGSSDTLTSALKYIPEVAWNDDPTSGSVSASQGGGLSASGGGASTLFSRPSWQTGVPGIASGSFRLVPDVSLYSSPALPGYLYCTSDTSNWVSGQQSSCTNGFRDGAGTSPTNDLTVAGGTSFATPIFAGMIAILNQSANFVTGQGLLNTTLYKLAANSSTYASAFHDVTTGNNFCTAGVTYGYCSANGATLGFSAGTGYDEVTGLGSVDLTALAAALTPSTSTLIGTTTALTAANTAPTINTADNITITVSSNTGSTTPSGNITLSVDGGTGATYTLTSNGTYVYQATFTTSGGHTVAVQYGGDSTHAASAGAVTVNVQGPKFTLSASPTSITVSQGKSGTSTVTITSQLGYAGTVNFSVQVASGSSLTQNGCYSIPSTPVAANGTATATLTLYTSQSACTAAGALTGGGVKHQFNTGTRVAPSSRGTTPAKKAVPVGAAALLGLALLGTRKRRARWISLLSCFVLLGILGAAVGCGSGSSGSSSSSTSVAKGTYSITVVGTDSTNSSTTASVPITLTVQ